MKFLLLFSVMIFTSPIQLDDQLLPTKLKVTVINSLGNHVEGATVSIYANKEDYLVSKKAVRTAKTDKKGRVTFKDLKLIPYFVEAKKGEETNTGEGVVTGKLAEGRINKVNTVIR